MNAVKGAGQDEVVVGAQLLQTRSEVSVEDEPAGLVDDEKSEDDPVSLCQRMARGLV